MRTAARRLPMLVPPCAVRGKPRDVPAVLPILSELSLGARRSVPGWVPTQPLAAPTITQRPHSASWLEVTYPFSTDEELRRLYMLGASESLRAGMFLEELDAFSADCSARHADMYNEARPLSVVTAAHDGLSIFEHLSARHDLRLRGCVVSVGTSSMEVRTDLLRVTRRDDRGTPEAHDDDDEEEFLGCCYTVMVARERATFGRAAVHQLAHDAPACDDEIRAAAKRAKVRKALAANSLAHTPPFAEEVPLLHELWREARDRAAAGEEGGGGEALVVRVPMAASEQHAVDIMQPTHRNMNGYMFGGYLMRRALEVGWVSAYRFARSPPSFAGLDDVSFNKPVELGAIIELVSRAVYSGDDETVRVCVEAHKVSLRSGRREPMNLFHFIFRVAAADGVQKRRVVQPDTYEEGMLYLEGRRRWLNSQGPSS